MAITRPNDGTDPQTAGFIWSGPLQTWVYPAGQSGISYQEWAAQHGGEQGSQTQTNQQGQDGQMTQAEMDAARQTAEQTKTDSLNAFREQQRQIQEQQRNTVNKGDFSKFDVSRPNYGLNVSDFGDLLNLFHQSGGNLAGLKSGFAQGTTIPDSLASFFADTSGGDGTDSSSGGTTSDILKTILGGGNVTRDGAGNITINNTLTGGNTSGSNTGTNDGSGKSLLDSLLPYLISGGAALGGGLLDRQAAKDAAQIQADAATKAAQLQADTAAASLGFQKDVYNQGRADNAPFLAGATNALSQVQGLIAPGGALSKDFVAPTKEEVQQSPGYQLQLDAAMKALGAQSRGITSGATVKAAERYATDYGDTKYNDATNQALNIFQTNRSNRLNPLMQIAGYGPAAVAQNASSGNSAASNVASINSNMANKIGSLNNQSAYQTASGNVSGTNALTNALTQIANLGIRKTA